MKKIVMVVVVLAMLALAATASAYRGHAGCPSYVPPYSTVTCAYHTDVSQVSAYTSTKHWVAFSGGLIGSCAPGPCTAWTQWLLPGKNGNATLGNQSPYGMYVYDVEEY